MARRQAGRRQADVPRGAGRGRLRVRAAHPRQRPARAAGAVSRSGAARRPIPAVVRRRTISRSRYGFAAAPRDRRPRGSHHDLDYGARRDRTVRDRPHSAAESGDRGRHRVVRGRAAADYSARFARCRSSQHVELFRSFASFVTSARRDPAGGARTLPPSAGSTAGNRPSRDCRRSARCRRPRRAAAP